MQIRILNALNELPAAQWNALVADGNPFLSHEFLAGLERHRCVGRRTGWIPRHVVALDGQGRLLGAVPLYEKHNFYGEFVFDHSWEAAYQRHGIPYYPKLVSAVPFTPATGQRLLLHPDAGPDLAGRLIHTAHSQVEALDCSSLHWLFPQDTDLAHLQAQGFMVRTGCQFHWSNRGYRDFEDFLEVLTSKKRKNIRRERRSVAEAGLELQILEGPQVSEAQWHTFHDFYCATFERRWGFPVLTAGFFQEIGRTLGDRVVLILASLRGREVAGALCLRSDNALYGRYWGCRAEFHHLHFETCYYQGIDYCIRRGLRLFEPGAQGEHKIARGFLPSLTHSAHWLAHPVFNEAVADFLRRETPAVQEYARALHQHSPYRQECADS